MNAAARLDAQEKWRLLAQAWKDTGPPAAPSLGDVANYLDSIARVDSKVLLLGCTPSIRSHGKDRLGVIVGVDLSPEMLAISESLVPTEANDVLVLGSWFHLPLASKSMDAVIGDKVFGNVMPEDWPKFVQELKRVLRPAGWLLTRASPRNPDELTPAHVPPLLPALVRRWTSKIGGLGIEEACSGLWEDCMDASTEATHPGLGSQRLSRYLGEDSDAIMAEDWSEIERQLLTQLLERYWITRDAEWSAYTERGLIGAIETNFTYVGSKPATDYPGADRQPVYCFIAT